MRIRRVTLAALTVAVAAMTAAVLVGGVGDAAQRVPTRLASPAAGKTPANGAAANVFLSVTGVQGEAIAPGYVNQIAVADYDWSTDSSSGKAQLGDLNVDYSADRSLPSLETLSEKGSTINSVVLTETDSAGKKLRTIALTNARADSVHLSVDPSGPDEKVTVKFSYQQEKLTYYYYTATGGGPFLYSSCWNTVNNTTC